jgi:hypothetical protein
MGAPVDQRLYGSKAITPAESTKNLLAERFKTKICQNFEKTGVCPYEVRCMFAHGAEDLRTTEMNFRDRLTSDDAIKGFQRSRLIAARQAKKRAKVAAQQLAEEPQDNNNTTPTAGHQTPQNPLQRTPVSKFSEPGTIEISQVTPPVSPALRTMEVPDLALYDLSVPHHTNALSVSSVLPPLAGEASLTSFVDHNFLTAPMPPLPPSRTASKSPAGLASSTFSVDSALSRSASRRFRHDPYNPQPLANARRSMTPSHLPQLSVEDMKVQSEHDVVSQSSTPQCNSCLSARRGSVGSAAGGVRPVSPLAAAMMAKRSANTTPEAWFEETSQPNFQRHASSDAFEAVNSGRF